MASDHGAWLEVARLYGDVLARGVPLKTSGLLASWGWGQCRDEGYTADETMSLAMDGAPVSFFAEAYIVPQGEMIPQPIAHLFIDAHFCEGYDHAEAWSLVLDGAEVSP